MIGLTLVLFLAFGVTIPLSMERVGRWLRVPTVSSTGAMGRPYESGIQPEGDTWQPQYVRYYIYALIFVLFDAETAVLYPWADAMNRVPPMLGLQAVVFMAMLLFGLVYAWKKGVLTWM